MILRPLLQFSKTTTFYEKKLLSVLIGSNVLTYNSYKFSRHLHNQKAIFCSNDIMKNAIQ